MADTNEIGQKRTTEAGVGSRLKKSGEGVAQGRVSVLADSAQLQCDGSDNHAGKRVEWGPLSELGNGGWAKHLAHANGVHAQGQQPGGSDEEGREGPLERPSGPCLAGIGREWRVEPDVGRVAHGVPDRAHRLAALGNAVVPQIPEMIGRAILEAAE